MASSTSPHPIQSVSTAELYNRWAKVYDTDGNILQAVDDSLVPGLLSKAFALVGSSSPAGIVVTELGCGTCRNTVKLLTLPTIQTSHGYPSTTSDSEAPSPTISQIHALDLSRLMLDVGRGRCQDLFSSTIFKNQAIQRPEISHHEFDALAPELYPSVLPLQGQADLVLSTLVLEHLPVSTFFRTIQGFLKPGGVLVLTNMHAEMGRRGQAGFLDGEKNAGGIKVRGQSYVYEVQEVVDAGKKEGFVPVGDVIERAIREEDVGEGRLLGERGTKWIGTQVWFGFIMRLSAN
ncbi:uncharacterized protein BP5553_01554 [Venustampulla echinocandica]|uniref:Methyltransferase type 11 domain-containing protein n=1 Tax=Venustampulla echinocandica TaxID=2656787 RepID=A0A370U1D7_9HELO|nr:uncharacterized protein BP5553_01554 [Venustampulla echinocandica]RDL41575.1 hypothetical protein BP5553_01554 [Venustampulla echinocandica]